MNETLLAGANVTYSRPGVPEFSGTVVNKVEGFRNLYLVRKLDGSVVTCDDRHLLEEMDPFDSRESFGTCY